MITLLVLCGVALLTILHRSYYDAQSGVAILHSIKVPLYALDDNPNDAAPLMELYEGAEMRVQSVAEVDQVQLSVAVELPDGTKGLIEHDAIELVDPKTK